MKTKHFLNYVAISCILLSTSCKKNTDKKVETEAEIIKEAVKEETSLISETPPSKNFDLKNWYLSIPTDTDGNEKADNISQKKLNEGYQNPDFFYTAADGGMVFKCPVNGIRTSKNTKYVRVELREMLKNGDKSIKTKGVTKNNWVFGSAPKEDLEAAGAVDGEMTATLAINHVTTTGKKSHVGRFIIGQIHANKDEPIRIYYRKLPENELGSIYFAHEINHGDDTYYEMIGSKKSGSPNPEDGIALNEKFSYKIKVVANDMWVTISRDGKEDIVQHVDMSASGYDEGGQYQFFKAGVYQGNNTGDEGDYSQVTFYDLKVTH